MTIRNFMATAALALLALAWNWFNNWAYAQRPSYLINTVLTERLHTLTPQVIDSLLSLQILPPAMFDHDYDGTMVVVRASPEDVRAVCWTVKPPAKPPLGCAVRSGAICTVTIADDVTLEASGWHYEIVLRHE